MRLNHNGDIVATPPVRPELLSERIISRPVVESTLKAGHSIVCPHCKTEVVLIKKTIGDYIDHDRVEIERLLAEIKANNDMRLTK